MLSPPIPLLSVKSPPWSMKLGITRWKMLPLLHSHRKGGSGDVSAKNGGPKTRTSLLL
jgi:hypothetical protein